MKSAFHTIPIWNRKLLLVVGWEEEKVLALISKYQMGGALRTMVKDNDHGKVQGCVYYDEEKGNCILVFPTNKPRLDTIAHECAHIAKFMLIAIGSRAYKDDENFNYLLEYLLNWTRKTLKKL